jgi:energy-coupling factor transporter transmembrane protein EcfT
MKAYHYRSGTSPLHRLDPRFKILCLVMLSAACLRADLVGLGLLSAAAALSVFKAEVKARNLLPAARFLLSLMGVIFLVRAGTTPGERLVSLLPLTAQGILVGARVVWRLLLLMFFGSLFAVTTKAGELQDSIRWYLRPVPRVPEARIATLIGLAVRFIPLVSDEAEEVSLAQKSRCVEQRKPWVRISALGGSLVRRSLLRAEDIALAMESRCYADGSGSVIALKSSPFDWAVLASVFAFCFCIAAAGI